MTDSAFRVGVFGSGLPAPGDPIYEGALVIGRELARRGAAVVCGGRGGVMEAACRGAAEEGGISLGVLVEGSSEPNAWVTRAVREPDLSARLNRLLRETQAGIFLPRGLGTLVEIAFFTESVAKGQAAPRPLVFLGESWRSLAMTAIEEASGPGAGALAECVRFAPTPWEAVALALGA
ncbi:MAG: LOG family protein [Thermoanaerobaculia bacterium]